MGVALPLLTLLLGAPSELTPGASIGAPTPPSIPRTADLPPSPPVPGLGPRLAAQIRGAAPDAPVRFLARALDPALVLAEGGRVTAQLGPVTAGVAPADAIARLARAALYLEAPKPLRPALDVSREAVRADVVDFGLDGASPARGADTLIAAYDTGVDLSHPDLRDVDGPSRVRALWDQALDGQPPAGHDFGHLCGAEALAADACAHRDRLGHGTGVLGVAASGGPRYRGVAPEADLLVAASDDFEDLLEALGWFEETAAALERPMVVNLSLSGQEGPHDGTSLECQALDALAHPVVVAAGNEGAVPVHALARLDKGDSPRAALRFPILGQPATRRAVVDIWGDVGLPLSAQIHLVRPGGAVVARTSTVSPGDPGRTEPLLVDTATIGWATLDAEATPNPFNGQGHVRIELELDGWEDDPEGLGYVTVQLRGEGRVDMWIDSPASEPAPVRWDRDRVLEIEDQVLGDTDHTISDLATAAASVAVSAWVGRTRYVDEAGATRQVGGTEGEIAAFSGFGPSLSPSTTGDKPDLAAPGLLVITARSRDAAEDPVRDVSSLYAAGGGTSLAAPHVSGAVAVLLGEKPDLTPEQVKAALLESANHDGLDLELEPRWGRGRLDVAAALGRVVERKSGCRCVAPTTSPSGVLVGLGAVLLMLVRRRRIS